MKNRFTTPKVKSYSLESGKEWYVWFRFNGGNPIRVKEGLNKIQDYGERLEEANLLAEVLHEKLIKGWDPRAYRKPSIPQPYQFDLTIIEAYKKALQLIQESNLETKTKQTYKTHLDYFTHCVKKLKWDKFLFVDFDMYHFKTVVEEIVKFRKKENSYFNKHIAICKAYCTILKEQFIVKENKAHGISKKKHVTKEKRLLSANEQSIIINHFENVMPAFNVYLKTLYHLAIRPKELRLLTCGMIKRTVRDGKELLFFSLPETITKNDKKGIILIPQDLQNDLLLFDLSNQDFFLFGKDFRPSEKIQSINNANKLWKTEVKDKLKIESDMYYLKSKSSNDKLRNGMSKEAVKIINRHSSEEITEIYATEHEIITMEQNIDKFGSFK